MTGTAKAVIETVGRLRAWEDGVPPRSEVVWLARLLAAAIATEDVVALQKAERGLHALCAQWVRERPNGDAPRPCWVDFPPGEARGFVHALDDLQLAAAAGIRYWRPEPDDLDLPWEMPTVTLPPTTERNPS